MKALVFNGPKDIRYESFNDPIIRDERNLVVKVLNCSICGSDLHMYHGDRIGKLDYSQPMQHFCTGHEAIGEVMEIGSGVRSHKVGDRIVISGGAACGTCRRCLAGQANLCEAYRTGAAHGTAYGISPDLNGGHADYLEVVNADLTATSIPEGVSDEQAILLTDALATGYYGVKMSGVGPGDTVAVIGQGPIGRLAAEAALAVGASAVYAIDPQASRRNMAQTFGAIGLHPDEAVQRVYEDTRGLGVDSVIEAVGVGPTLTQAVKMARVGGRLSVLGILQANTSMPLHIVQGKSLVVHMGIAGIVDSWPELIPMLQSGRIKGEGVFTHHFDLSDGAEAYRMFDAQEDGVMKLLITP
ncbi:theronine dehydrogenase [Halioglobus maricola]|uniref:Theronine dehydrogenase n=1 Tax=Halioglobus maricola TaxID=2601894 RepID=A0A5P9NLH3_9GAMM|nr:alcohol dehydrogenase catalytic domain-containing protein [Halioglobus maricola]QFU75778.1 theronine dehydrogenase [Halioglobus maricola]